MVKEGGRVEGKLLAFERGKVELAHLNILDAGD